MGNFDIPDAPWVGLCKEDWEELYGSRRHSENYMDAIEEDAERQRDFEEWERMQENDGDDSR